MAFCSSIVDFNDLTLWQYTKVDNRSITRHVTVRYLTVGLLPLSGSMGTVLVLPVGLVGSLVRVGSTRTVPSFVSFNAFHCGIIPRGDFSASGTNYHR